MPDNENAKLYAGTTAIDPPKAVAPAAHAYAELDVTTNFSFLRGASHPDELVYTAALLGHRAMAVTDLNSLAGIVRAYDPARKVEGFRLIVGARLAFADDTPDLLVWPTDRAAYARLSDLLTVGRRRAPKGECHLYFEDFLSHQQGLLAAAVPRCDGETDDADALHALRDVLRDRLSLAVTLTCGDDDEGRLLAARELGRRTRIPLLATNHVHYHDPGRRPLQDVLTCVRHGCRVAEAGHRLFPNGERYLKSPEQMARLFQSCPSAIGRGVEIASRCKFDLGELRYEYPTEVVPPGSSPSAHLRQLTHAGAATRYPQGIPQKVRDLLEKELKFICGSKYESYFLTVHDLVRHARSIGILCQGRGSAANSAVCYCLGVTSVDPAHFQLVFERFASESRAEPPDIDIDFEHERREEVIQYVYAKYGRDRAAMTASLITYRGRSAIRDVGKALGFSQDALDALAGKLDWWHRGSLSGPQLRECGIDPADATIRHLISLTTEMLGFPRHLSQHVGGMVISQKPLRELVPVENAAMADRTVIEWDKDDLDVVGLFKIDILALGMLTAISKALVFASRGLNTKARRHEGTKGKEREENIDVIPKGKSSPRTTGFQPVRDVFKSGGFTHSRSSIGAHGLEARGTGRAEEQCPDKAAPPSSSLRAFVPSCLRVETERQGASQQSPPLDLHTIPWDDKATYDMISDADTIGVFQVESRAQMSMLPRLRPQRFYDLVIEVAIVRPGPIQGDMVHPYLQRREAKRLDPSYEPEYEKPELREVLKETLGVPLFQEQAMRMAIVAAGFTGGEADQLRRAMAAWKRGGGLEHFQGKFLNGMHKNGYSPEFAGRCFKQICGFGQYGFPESHAASFALLVYASAWLKRHHPSAFAAALLNSQPMGFYAPAQLVRDAREHGVDVRPIDVNASAWDCTLEPGGRGKAYHGPGVENRCHEESQDAVSRLSVVPRDTGFQPVRNARDEGEPRLSQSADRTHGLEARVTGEASGSLSPVRGGEGGGEGPGLQETRSASGPLTLIISPPYGGEGTRATPGENSTGPLNSRYLETATDADETTPASPNPHRSTWGRDGPALRLGLRQVKGLRQADVERIVAAREKHGPFTSIEQFHAVSGVSAAAVRRLAEADALRSLGDSRRPAIWRAMSLTDEQLPLFPETGPQREASPVALPKMPDGQEVRTDYATAGLSLKQHPVFFVRPTLARAKVIPAMMLRDAAACPHGRYVRVAGLVLVRQRPGTASGVVFVTLEDETGIANLILWSSVYDQYRAAARHAVLLEVAGYVQREGQVVHVLARRLTDRTELMGCLSQPSRDFH